MAIAKFERQLDFLGDPLSITSTTAAEAGSATIRYRITLDPSLYDNVTGFYIEVAAKNSSSGTGTVTLRNGSTTVTNGTVSITGTSYARFRNTTAMTFPSTTTTYNIYVNSSVSTNTVSISAARLIIIQGSTATKSAEHILMSSSDSTTGTTAAQSAYTMGWVYHAANWNKIASIKFKATQASSSTQSTYCVLYDITSSTVIATLTQASATAAVQVSADIKASLVDGHEYRVYQYVASGTGYHGNAELEIAQSAGYNVTEMNMLPYDAQLGGATVAGGTGKAHFDPSLYDTGISVSGIPVALMSADSGTTASVYISTDGTNPITGGTLQTTATSLTHVENAAISTPVSNTEYTIVVPDANINSMNMAKIRWVITGPTVTTTKTITGTANVVKFSTFDRGEASNTSSPASLTVNSVVSSGSGSLLALIHNYSGNVSGITDTSGRSWSLVTSNATGGTSDRASIWICANPAALTGNVAVSFSGSPSGAYVQIVEVTNTMPSPVDVSAGSGGSTGTTINAGLTTLTAGDAIVSFMLTDLSSMTITKPTNTFGAIANSWTDGKNTTAFVQAGAAGAVTLNWTLSQTWNFGWATVALKIGNAPTARTITGVARISGTTSRGQTGVANILGTVVQTTIPLNAGYWTVTGTTYGYINGAWQFNAADFASDFTAYLEFEGRHQTAGAVVTYSLWDVTLNAQAGPDVTITGNTQAAVRSNTDMSNYLIDGHVYRAVGKVATGTGELMDARLIILNNFSGSPTNNIQYIPVTNAQTGFTNTAYATSPSTKYFLYEDAKWDGETIYFEASGWCTGGSSLQRAYARLWDNTAGAAVSGSEVYMAGGDTVEKVMRSGAITLIDGHEYIVQYYVDQQGNSAVTGQIDTANVVITQTNPSKWQVHRNLENTSRTSTSLTDQTFPAYMYLKPIEFNKLQLSAVHWEADMYSDGTNQAITGGYNNTAGASITGDATQTAAYVYARTRASNIGLTMPVGNQWLQGRIRTSNTSATAASRHHRFIFELSTGTVTTKTITGTSRINLVTLRTQTGVSRIQKTTLQTQTAHSRITITTLRTQTATARVTAKTLRTQTGVARLTAKTLRTQTGLARLTATTLRLQTGVSRITITTARAQTGHSRLTAQTNRTQTGVANILVTITTSRAQTGLARLTVTTLRTQLGVSRITATVQRSQTALARITIQTSRTTTGHARIALITLKTQLGLARIALVTLHTTTGTARVTKTVPRTQTGLSRITATTLRLQTGKASVKNTTLRTQTGHSRITITTLRLQTGKSSVLRTTQRAQTGVANLLVTITTTQTQLGTARISVSSAQTISGQSRITAIGPLRKNLITNPSFETDLSNWQLGGGVAMTRDTIGAQDGDYSLHFQSDGYWNDVLQQSLIPVTPGKKYSAQARVTNPAPLVANPSGSNQHAMQLYFYWQGVSGEGNFGSTSQLDMSVPHDGTLVYGTVTAPAGATSMAFYIYQYGIGDAYYDNVQVEEYPGITPFFIGTDILSQYGVARISVSSLQTLTGVARITAQSNRTQTGTSRITAKTLRTQAGVARITAKTLRTQTGKAAVRQTTLRTQLGISRITAKTLRLQAGVARLQRTTLQTITGVSRIALVTLQALTGRSRITTSTAQAQLGTSRIGLVSVRTVTGISRITLVSARAQTGHSRITASALRTQLGLARITVSTQRAQTGVAKITAQTNRTQSGKAAIKRTTLRTQLGLSRITVSTSRAQVGTSRITVSSSQPILGASRITITSLQTISGLARVTAQTQQSQIGVSRITARTLQTILGTSRLTLSTQRISTGLARITISTSRTQSGVSRITRTTLRTQTGVSRITLVTSRTITGLSRITAATARAQLGKAAIKRTTTQVQVGQSRITALTVRTQAGLAAIKRTTTQSITGVTRITTVDQKMQLGVARITITTARSQAGTARITDITQRYQTGRARITQIVAKQQTGLSRIALLTVRTITGASRITASDQRYQTGHSRITQIVPKTITGVSRVTASTVRAQLGRSAIFKTTTQAVTGAANVTNLPQKTIAGKAAILVTQGQDQDGVARIQQISTTKQKFTNPNMEGGSTLPISGWAVNTGQSGVSIDATNAFRGSQSIKIAVNSSNTNVGIHQPSRTPVNPSTVYTFSIFVMSDTPGALQVQFVDDQNRYYQGGGLWSSNAAYFTINTTTGWRQYRLDITTDIAQSSIYIDDFKRSGTGSQANRTFWIDYAELWEQGQPELYGLARITAATVQALTGVARITATSSQSIAGRSRISLVTARTQLGKASIKKTTLQTQLGRSRITILSVKTQLGKAAVRRTTTQAQAGLSRITIATVRSNTGTSRITRQMQRTQLGVAAIRRTTQQAQIGVARITIKTVRSQTGISDVRRSTQQSLTGHARIELITSRTQTGVARLLQIVERTQTGHSRVQQRVDQTATGRSRITVHQVQAILGHARIATTANHLILGTSRIEQLRSQPITGHARIAYITHRDQLGRSSIAAKVLQQLQGRTAVINQQRHNQYGVARIIDKRRHHKVLMSDGLTATMRGAKMMSSAKKVGMRRKTYRTQKG